MSELSEIPFETLDKTLRIGQRKSEEKKNSLHYPVAAAGPHTRLNKCT
jgi:hypothetical protein